MEQERKLIHVVSVIKTEYDLDAETKEVLNVKNTVLKTEDIEFESKRQKRSSSAPKTDKITIETLSEKSGVAIAYMRQNSVKLTKAAAKVLGVINDEGEVYKTPNGKNVRIRTRYVKDSTTKIMYPIMEVVDSDEPDRLPQVNDSLTISFNGRDKEYLSGFGIFFVMRPAVENPNIIVLDSFDSIDELAKSYNVEMPEGFVLPRDSVYSSGKSEDEEKVESNEEPKDDDEGVKVDEEENVDALKAPSNLEEDEQERKDRELDEIIGNALSDTELTGDDNDI